MDHLLFPIKLIGEGSAEVESFPSYVHRCAYGHGVHVGQFIQYVHGHAIGKTGEEFEVGLPNYMKVNEMTRPKRTTQMLVNLFSFMTKQNLHNSILWFLSGSLGKSNNEIVKGFRWCPECFSEMRSLGQVPYFKLIWHLRSVKACHIHRTPLIERCEFCRCKQTSYKKNQPPGYCLQCGKKLSERKTSLLANQIYNSWDDIGWDIIKLFEDVNVLSQRNLPENGVKLSLETVHHFYWENDREIEFYQLLSKNEMLALTFGDKKIALKSARKIAYRLGVSLLDLINGNAANSNEVLDKRIFCRLPEGYLEPEHKVKRDHKKIFKEMNSILGSRGSAVSWKELARKLNVSVGYLDYRYPILGKEVKMLYQEHKKEDHLHRLYSAQKFALRYFFDEKYSRFPQSRKQAYKHIIEETGLPKFMLKNAIQNAYSIMYP